MKPERESPSLSVPGMGELLARLAPQAHARRIVFLLDGRPAMRHASASGDTYLKLAARKAGEILLGCHHAREATLIRLGSTEAPYIVRCPAAGPGHDNGGMPAETIVEIRRRIETFPPDAPDDLTAAFARACAALGPGNGEFVLILFLADSPPSGGAPTRKPPDIPGPLHVFLYGRPGSGPSLLPWVLQLTRVDGSASVTP